MTTPSRMSRRTVLRGLGTAMALPLLDCMTPVVSAAVRGGPYGAAAAKTRMAFLFVPNGVNLDHWTPQKTGYDFDLPYVLQPLVRVKNDLLVLSGLTHDKGRANGDGPGDHARSASVFLTGAQPRKTSGAEIRSGVSVDQVAAQKIGSQTRFASLEIGCEEGRNAGNCDSGYSCAYSSNISWTSPTSPNAKEINPRLVFERLFAGDRQSDVAENQGRRDLYKKSILDFVTDDARRLQSRLGQADRAKLDEYLSGVREIERRVEMAEEQSPRKLVAGVEKPSGVPEEYAEHIRLMSDMLVLAFRGNLTRVATFMFANAGSNRSYRPIGVPDGHHDLSHHGGNPEKLDKIRQINRFHVAQLAYLLEKMKATPEGEGTLLDNSMIVYGSGLSDGNRHNNENLPVILAGGGSGTIAPGRHVRYPTETPMTNLFLSMLDRVGAPAAFVGDSTGRLPYLS